ncbi:hypothetical protein DQ04_01621090 [Trypanosoma grayi]|uniref:hypothetical protein n=1 Tax=Trypanosoma grayi TaxID=71804 RepID=UPI0004F40454|nr:hypothetical protein DQ04_01621090 [Trypanosoma grayi]KEG12556.1 hypothetical protein DQ04_01621090 [Trypanosoma grayi]
MQGQAGHTQHQPNQKGPQNNQQINDKVHFRNENNQLHVKTNRMETWLGEKDTEIQRWKSLPGPRESQAQRKTPEGSCHPLPQAFKTAPGIYKMPTWVAEKTANDIWVSGENPSITPVALPHVGARPVSRTYE